MKFRNSILCIVAFLPLVLFAKESPRAKASCLLPRPVNVVPDGPLIEEDACPEPTEPDKAQYASVNDDLPIFAMQTTEADFEGGAFYRDGSELYIRLEPSYVPTWEVIEEKVSIPEKKDASS